MNENPIREPEGQWRAVCACGWTIWAPTREMAGKAAILHSDAAGGAPLRVEEVKNPRPVTAAMALVGFSPVQVFPPGDKLTIPLLRLMLAADDVRLARNLYVETSERLRAAVGVPQRLLTGEHWYALRLFFSHLHEAIDAVATLIGSSSPTAIKRLLKGQAGALEAFETLRTAAGIGKPARKQTFLYKARMWIGSHYPQKAIGRVFGKYAGVPGYLEGTVTASEVAGLTRFIMTDSLAVLLLLDAAGATLPTTMATEVDAARFRTEAEAAIQGAAAEALPLAGALTTFVDSLVHTLVQQRGTTSIERTTIEVPPLLRAAIETEDMAHSQQSTQGTCS